MVGKAAAPAAGTPAGLGPFAVGASKVILLGVFGHLVADGDADGGLQDTAQDARAVGVIDAVVFAVIFLHFGRCVLEKRLCRAAAMRAGCCSVGNHAAAVRTSDQTHDDTSFNANAFY